MLRSTFKVKRRLHRVASAAVQNEYRPTVRAMPCNSVRKGRPWLASDDPGLAHLWNVHLDAGSIHLILVGPKPEARKEGADAAMSQPSGRRAAQSSAAVSADNGEDSAQGAYLFCPDEALVGCYATMHRRFARGLVLLCKGAMSTGMNSVSTTASSIGCAHRPAGVPSGQRWTWR